MSVEHGQKRGSVFRTWRDAISHYDRLLSSMERQQGFKYEPGRKAGILYGLIIDDSTHVCECREHGLQDALDEAGITVEENG